MDSKVGTNRMILRPPPHELETKIFIGQIFSHESLVTPTLLRSCTKIITVTLVQIQYNISSIIKLIVTKIEVWERRILLES